MNRRNLLLAGAACLAAPSLITTARAQSAPDASALGGDDFTPFGAERAASKSGLVPAWTGGVSTPPAGWEPSMFPPDLFGGEQPLFSVSADNQDKYASLMCDGQREMFRRFGGDGFRMDVYPAHRTACAPQYVYDNTKLNVARAQPGAGGLVYGIQGAVCGTPFPIPSSDPNVAGAQIIWNHLQRWGGAYLFTNESNYVVGSGTRTLTTLVAFWMRAPYYVEGTTPEEYAAHNIYLDEYVENLAPPNQVGGKILAKYSSNTQVTPDTAFEYLQGLGRVRQLPGTEYDIPASEYDDAANYDEIWGWNGALDRYNWKLLGKKEMIVLYNQHKMHMSQPNDVMGLKFVNPDLTRYEVHRVWVVEARLAPGKRHVEPLRRFYVDEDTWAVLATEAYDDQNNLWKFGQTINQCQPDLPGTRMNGNWLTNFQAANYLFELPFYMAPRPEGGVVPVFTPISDSRFEQQSMANSGGL